MWDFVTCAGSIVVLKNDSMGTPGKADKEFMELIDSIISEHFSNEQFGVSELAQKAGMSRSNLLRKVKRITGVSVSQYIRRERLKYGMDMLKSTSLNVSEVSYRSGFNSTSYFIKCFHEVYGYPPGEVGTRQEDEADSTPATRWKRALMIGIPAAVALVAIVAIIIQPWKRRDADLEKSIAVLPFKNESADASNTYLVNGLMEAVLNNLQQINDLRVISRTSMEKYRHSPQLIPEIAKELNVSYLVEGSGQKVGNKILLNVQLIEARTDRHLWAEQYEREVEDIFTIQKEVAKSIANEVQAVITPEEKERIEKLPTDNFEAYDLFMKGLDLMYTGEEDKIYQAIDLYLVAIQLDPGFARAYAAVSISYYFLDAFQAEKQYLEQINTYADKAMLLDPDLEQSLIAKGMYYFNNREPELGLPYLDRALHLNPNSLLVINILSDFYATKVPNTEKYLEYAMKGLQLEFPSTDSVAQSFSYLHMANAFIQTGFPEQAKEFINLSLKFDPENLYSVYVKAYIDYVDHRDMTLLNEDLLSAFDKDITRLDILQEVAKTYYYMRDFERAYAYYKPFNDARKEYKLDVYPFENSKIAVTYDKVGNADGAKELFTDFFESASSDQSLYRDLNLCVYYSYKGQVEKAIDHLAKFSDQSDFHYWTILFLDKDPLIDNIKDHPDFQPLYDKITTTFWEQNQSIRKRLEREGLI